LKPENVLVHQSGHVKLSDFGSSRFFKEITAGDRLEGTADYLAPEVLRGRNVSPASDLWSFACTLYQMLAGRVPIWAGDDPGIKPPSAAEEKKEADDIARMSASERAAHREGVMKRHEEAQKANMLSKMVQFETADPNEDRYPEKFDPAARELIDAIMKPDPSQRIGIRRRNGENGEPVPLDAPSGGVAWEIDFSVLKSHPFFGGVDFDLLPTLPAPSLAGGRVQPAPDARWARRKNSIMWAPMPKQYSFAEGAAAVMEPIPEEPEKELAAARERTGGAAAGPGSMRAQLFASKTGSVAAPRFMGVQESAEEGGDSDMAEGSEEEEEDREGEEAGAGLQDQMLSAAFPGGAGLPPKAPSSKKPSSRASGPMAVVERPKDEDSQEDAMGSTMSGERSAGPIAASAAALPPRPAVRAPLGLKSKLPPSGASRPQLSFVPKADATAGPTGLGMGLRKMGGSSTASALLARVLNKPATLPPTANLPHNGHPDSEMK
jgi:hypothetical protein